MIPHELLWKAWPKGFLAMRGVATVDGWVCTRTPGQSAYANPRLWTFWAPQPVFAAGSHEAASVRRLEGDLDMEAIRQRGALLPNVDPADVATWACLLDDLYTAFWAASPVGSVYWRHSRPEDMWTMGCVRTEPRKFPDGSVDPEAGVRSFHVDPPEASTFTKAPALALVLARIQIREEKGR